MSLSQETTDRPINASEGVDAERRLAPVDVYVGARVRLRRTLLRMSQEKLGRALGVTFQQVQKYERGTNRIGVGRLLDLSNALDVPVEYFFNAMPSGLGQPVQDLPAASSASTTIHDFFQSAGSPEVVALVRDYYRIEDPAVRRRVIGIMKDLAPPE